MIFLNALEFTAEFLGRKTVQRNGAEIPKSFQKVYFDLLLSFKHLFTKIQRWNNSQLVRDFVVQSDCFQMPYEGQ